MIFIGASFFIRRLLERLSEGRPLAECPIPQNDCWSVGSMDGVIPGLLTALGFVKERSSSNEDSIMVERCIQMHKRHTIAKTSPKRHAPWLIFCWWIYVACNLGDPAEASLLAPRADRSSSIAYIGGCQGGPVARHYRALLVASLQSSPWTWQHPQGRNVSIAYGSMRRSGIRSPSLHGRIRTRCANGVVFGLQVF
jgi:hypothetical protein